MDCVSILENQYLYSTVWLLAAFLPVLIWLYMWYWSKKFKYWQKRDVHHVPGRFPYGSDSEYTKADIFPGHLIKKVRFCFICNIVYNMKYKNLITYKYNIVLHFSIKQRFSYTCDFYA